MDWSFIDKVVYINLAKRTDRREHMEEFTKQFGDKVIRFEAIERTPGWLGCSLSHIEVLKMAIENQWKNILILEDDCVWNKYEIGCKMLNKLLQNPYDVILLGGSWARFESKTSKILYSQATSSYLVNAHYYQTLLNNFEEGFQLLESNGHYQYTIDRYWNNLIEKDNWFMVVPNLIYQMPNFSDNTNRFMNYDSCFILNINEITIDFKDAIWGTETHKIDVTNTIKNLPKGESKFLDYTLFESDPHPYNHKELRVSYNDGRYLIIPENTLFSLLE